MDVLPFAATGRRPARPPHRSPTADAIGSFRAPSGRTGTFAGSYRLERLLCHDGRLTAVGVFTGELTDADGRRVGLAARRRTVVAQVASLGSRLLVLIDPLVVDLLGLAVSLDGIALDVDGTSAERAARRAMGLPWRTRSAPDLTGRRVESVRPCP